MSTADVLTRRTSTGQFLDPNPVFHQKERGTKPGTVHDETGGLFEDRRTLLLGYSLGKYLAVLVVPAL
jgi:hypothetical protein